MSTATTVAIIAVVLALPAILEHYAFAPHFHVHDPSAAGVLPAVLITGASSGIGKHAALALAQEHGWLVFAGVRKERDATALRDAAGGTANLVPVILDVTSGESIDGALDAVRATLDARRGDGAYLAGLVNNAGVSGGLPIEAEPLDRMRWVFDVNVFGLVDVTQRCLPLLRAETRGKGGGARIVMISSVAGFVSRPFGGTYSATKFAVEALSDSLRLELGGAEPNGDDGMSVSVVQPAFVKTKIAGKQLGANAPEKQLSDAAHRARYGAQLAARTRARAKSESMADPPTVTTEAIVDALTSRAPRARYRVANANGLPAWLVHRVVATGGLLRDRARDFVIARKMGYGGNAAAK